MSIRETGRFAVLAVVALAASACAATGAVPRPFPGAAPAGSSSGAVLTGGAPYGAALSRTALALTGTPYRNGGSDPSGFDCSGFTQYVFGRHGMWLPREVRQQFEVGERVSGELWPGDLVFFRTEGGSASHVAILIGGPEGDSFVHAPSARGVVRVERLSANYWARRYVGARRVN